MNKNYLNVITLTATCWTKLITWLQYGKCKQFSLGRQRGVMAPGVPSVDGGNHECDTLLLVCLLFVNNVIYGMLCFVKNVLERITSRLVRSSYIQRRQSLSERVGPRIILLKNLLTQQSSWSLSCTMYEFKLRKR